MFSPTRTQRRKKMEVTSRRKLKPENEDTNSVRFDKIVTETTVVTETGERATVPITGFDLNTLKKFKPYDRDVGLPPAVFSYEDKKGRRIRVCVKEGEPRYYFNGNEFIRTWIGPNGKKRTPVRVFKPNTKPTDKQAMNYLLKSCGIPQYG